MQSDSHLPFKLGPVNPGEQAEHVPLSEHYWHPLEHGTQASSPFIDFFISPVGQATPD